MAIIYETQKRYFPCCFVFMFLLILCGDALYAQYDYPYMKDIYPCTYKATPLNDGIDVSGNNFLESQIFRTNKEVRNVNFSGCNFNYSHFAEVHFVDCSFKEASLTEVHAITATFEKCDFTNAYISRAQIVLNKEQLCSTKSYKMRMINGMHLGGNLTETDFSGYDLTDVSLFNACVVDCDFTNATISGARFNGKVPVIYIKKPINPRQFAEGENFSKKQLSTTKDYQKSCIVGVGFSDVDLSGMDFSRMNLTRCNFSGNLKNVNFTDAIISECCIFAVENLTIEQIKSTWNYKVGSMEGIVLPKHIQDALDAEKKETQAKRINEQLRLSETFGQR